jgi:hypothetical protein
MATLSDDALAAFDAEHALPLEPEPAQGSRRQVNA